jgi:diguanylate cyclase (GGDEF)-like protein/PAS domain S-box-containing protein
MKLIRDPAVPDAYAQPSADARSADELRAALRAAEARFETLARLSSEWYWEQDTQWRFTLFSKGEGASATQPDSAHSLGRCRWDMPGAQPLVGTWDEHRAQLQALRPFRDFEYRHDCPQQGVRWFSVSGEPHHDAHGRHVGWRGRARDITVQKRAENAQAQARQLLDDIVENLPTSVLLKSVRDDYRIVRYNKAAEALYGLSRHEAVGRNAHELWPPEEAERIVSADREQVALRCAQEFPDRLLMTRRRGRIRVHMRKVPLFDAAGEVSHLLVIADDITDRLEAEARLRESEARFRSLTQLSSDWYWEQDTQYRFLPTSDLRPMPFRSAFRFEGRTRWEVDGSGVTDSQWQAHREMLDARLPFRDFQYARANIEGDLRYVSISGVPKFDEAGRFTGYRGVGKDITEAKRAERRIRLHALQQSLTSSLGQLALADTDVDTLFEQAAAATAAGLEVEFSALLQAGAAPDGGVPTLVLRAGVGWRAGCIGRAVEGLELDRATKHGRVWATREAVVVDTVPPDERRAQPALFREQVLESAVIVPMCGSAGIYGLLGAYSRSRRGFTPENVDFVRSVANILATAIDRRNAEQRLTYLAQFDTLTGLPNRSLFLDRFGQTLTQAARSDWLVGVLFVDLDRFKIVNDTLGHGVGDQLLVQVAQRLSHCVRTADTVGRLGGDEFAFVLPDLARADDAGLVAEKVVAQLARPFELDGQEVYVSASIGIAIYPGDGDDPDVLLRNADTAMYRTKEAGRASYQFYRPQMNERAAERLKLESQLRGALERGEFVLHYQPKVGLDSGEISGFEALLRWQHPVRGLVPPLEFISILEDTGLIVPVGEWVVRSVCAQLLQWQRDGVPLRPVAVNLSARQFQQADLGSVVAAIIADAGIEPGLLEFELTESMLMNDPEAAVRTLQRMRTWGVRLAVDDFGTGYSSLAYLKRFPLDALKIDRAFIRDITTDPDDAAITQAIIGLAHSMKLTVVAEGVESLAQLAFLRARGCDEMQGYYFARPLPAAECTQALRSGRRLHDDGTVPVVV